MNAGNAGITHDLPNIIWNVSKHCTLQIEKCYNMQNFLFARGINIYLQAIKSDEYCLERSISWWVYGEEKYFVYVLANIHMCLNNSSDDHFQNIPKTFKDKIEKWPHDLKENIISRCTAHTQSAAIKPEVKFVEYWPILLLMASHIYQRKFGMLKWNNDQWTNYIDDGDLAESLENLNLCNLNEKIKDCSIIFWDRKRTFFVGVPYEATIDEESKSADGYYYILTICT